MESSIANGETELSTFDFIGSVIYKAEWIGFVLNNRVGFFEGKITVYKEIFCR